jgi:hypothetical protein
MSEILQFCNFAHTDPSSFEGQIKEEEEAESWQQSARTAELNTGTPCIFRLVTGYISL